MAPFVPSPKPAASTRQPVETRDLGASPSVLGAAPAPKALLSDKYVVGEELGRGAFGQVQHPPPLLMHTSPFQGSMQGDSAPAAMRAAHAAARGNACSQHRASTWPPFHAGQCPGQQQRCRNPACMQPGARRLDMGSSPLLRCSRAQTP